jgi:carbamoyl-phosphate synthase large subunit
LRINDSALTQLKILLTGAGGPSTEAIWNLWGAKHDVFFADANIGSISALISANKKFTIPTAHSTNFLNSIINLSFENKIDILISQVDEELKILADNRKLFEPTVLLIPESNFIDLFLDKLKSGIEMNTRNVLEPSTEELSENSSYKGSPVIFKPRFGRGSRNLFFAENQKDFEATKSFLLNKKEKFILQEKILGEEYSVQMLANSNGKLSGITPLLIKSKKGSTTDGIVVNNKQVIRACIDFHDKFKTSGTYNIQLILRKEQVYVFEVNPRVSTTLCVSLFSGLDPIEIYSENNDFEKIKNAPEGLQIQRHWHHTFTMNS